MARRPGKSLNRQDVIQSAISLIQKEGTQALCIKDLANDLNIRPPSLYNHVKSNQDLHKAVAITGLFDLYEVLRLVSYSADAKESIKSLARQYREFAKNNPSLYAVMTTTYIAADDPDAEDLHDKILFLFRQALATFALDDANIIHLVRALRASLHGFVSLENSRQFNLDEDINQSFELLLDSLLGNL